MFENAFYWLIGERCPLECGGRVFEWRSHSCPKLAGKTDAEKVRVAIDLARSVLGDMPAGKDVHGAFGALNDLDDEFQSRG